MIPQGFECSGSDFISYSVNLGLATIYVPATKEIMTGLQEISMKILAHRGLWFNGDERNSLPALFRGLDGGYGLETDVRDLNGQLIISHDMPTADTAVSLDKLLCYYTDGGFTSTLALNIKADGLQEKLHRKLQDHNIKHYFVFDMSVPDTLGYLKIGMPTFVRRSELEHHPEITSRAQGVWLDELCEPWIDEEVILEQAAETDAVCIVSGELHGREYASQWAKIESALNLGCPSSKLRNGTLRL